MSRVIWADRAATAVLWAIAIAVVGVLLAIIAHFLLASLGSLTPSFLVDDPSDTAIGGIGPVLFNSVYVLVLTLLITVPLGVMGGIYMAEYAGEGRVTTSIRFCQELISSVPSIVVGMFGLALFVSATHWGYTALGGSLALVVFNLPLLARLTEQAIRAVPVEERHGSLALGATKWHTIRHVVLPIAIPGIVTGVILTAGRIFGFDRESAARFSFLLALPVIFGAGVFKMPDIMKSGLGAYSTQFFWGFVASAVSGFLVIWGLLSYLRTRTFFVFMVFRIAVAVLVFALIATGARSATI